MTNRRPPGEAKALDRALEAIDRRAEKTLALLQNLIRIPSETHPPGGDEHDAQLFVGAEFERLDLEVDQFEPWSVPGITKHPAWWPGLDYTDRPNVVGVLRGQGGGRSLILNGHIDVVPAGDRELWDANPYSGARIGDRIVGRGSADMKGGIAAMVSALEGVRDAGIRLRGDVILESVVNEEFGGMNGTLACCVKGYTADAAIVTEPTSLRVIAATKGGQAYRATVRGLAVHHGWWWQGVSALDNAMVVRDALRSWEERRAAQPSPSPLHADTTRFPRPALADTVWSLRAGDEHLMATPNEAVLDFWVDVLPGEDRETTLAEFEEHVLKEVSSNPFLRDHPPTLERRLMRPFAGAAVPLPHPIVDTMMEAHAFAAGEHTRIAGGPAANDSMIFNEFSSTPAIVYGPGSTLTAHAPNEYVPVAEVLAATRTLAAAMIIWCGVTDA